MTPEELVRIRALMDQPAEIERRIEKLAAQPEEAKG